MTISGAQALMSLLWVGSALAQPTDGEGRPSGDAYARSKLGEWLFPVENLNRALPPWLRFGGEFRTRFETDDGIGYRTTNDTYLLTRFRFNMTIQPVKW